MIEYQNIPRTIGAVVSAGNKATLHECQTIYGMEDIYKFIELIMVDGHNRRLAEKQTQDRQN